MSSAVCFNLGQSKILSCGNGSNPLLLMRGSCLGFKSVVQEIFRFKFIFNDILFGLFKVIHSSLNFDYDHYFGYLTVDADGNI